MGKEVECPECGYNFVLEEELAKGDTMHCPGCYGRMKVVSSAPLKLEKEPDEWEEYEDDEIDE